MLRSKVKRLAASLGYNLSKQPDHEIQHRLFEALLPFETNHRLIRLGGDGDGGYVLPDDLDGIAACFSPGVGDQSSFELDVLKRGIRCFQIDGTIETSPIADNPLVEFERTNLGPVTENNTISLRDWVVSKEITGDLILEIDIEGDEWLTIASTPDDILQRFRIICVEFHGLEHMFDKFSFRIMSHVLWKLARLFTVVHIHPNNWCTSLGVSEFYQLPGVMEYTFLRNDRVQNRPRIASYPNPLDRECCSNSPTIDVPKSLVGL